MIALLLANWKSVVAAAAAFALSLMLHKLDVHRIEAKHTAEILSVKAAMTAQCNKEKAITTEVSHAYQTELASLNRRLSDARRLHARSCVVVTGAAAGHDGAASSGKSAGSGVKGNRPVAAETLIDLFGEGEKYRLQLWSCQTFIKRTWAEVDGR